MGTGSLAVLAGHDGNAGSVAEGRILGWEVTPLYILIKSMEYAILNGRTVITAEAAIKLISRYGVCWSTEVLFSIVKNGCRIDSLRSVAVEFLEQALAFLMMVAWRSLQFCCAQRALALIWRPHCCSSILMGSITYRMRKNALNAKSFEYLAFLYSDQ